MTDTTVPVVMLLATLGLMLGFAPRRIAIIAIAVPLVVAPGLALLPAPDMSAAIILQTLWLTIAVLSMFVFWPRFQSTALTIMLAVLTGMIAGVALTPLSRAIDLAPLLALSVVVPATFAVLRGYAIAPRVVMTWLLAVTMLGAILPHVVAHPGYVDDHRE